MSMRKALARMIGVRDDQTEDALQDERRAGAAVKLSRRGFFAAGATMAAAPLVPRRAYSFLFAQPPLPTEALSYIIRPVFNVAWMLVGVERE